MKICRYCNFCWLTKIKEIEKFQIWSVLYASIGCLFSFWAKSWNLRERIEVSHMWSGVVQYLVTKSEMSSGKKAASAALGMHCERVKTFARPCCSFNEEVELFMYRIFQKIIRLQLNWGSLPIKPWNKLDMESLNQGLIKNSKQDFQNFEK